MDLTAYALLFVAVLLTSNMTAAKVVQLGGFVVPAAVVAYILAFISMDIIHERFGYAQARKVVYLGFMAQRPPRRVMAARARATRRQARFWWCILSNRRRHISREIDAEGNGERRVARGAWER